MKIFKTAGLVLLLLLLPPELPAQVSVDTSAAAPAAGAVAQQELQEAPIQPVRLPPSATTRTYVHVFLAFGVAFLLLWLYMATLGRGVARLEDEVRQLRR